MAAPITHIVLTEKLFNKYFQDKDKKEFIIGTSLPDIRYLGTIERDKTHFPSAELKEIVNYGSFECGLNFHSIVDRVRENFLLTNNIYDFMPKSKYRTQTIKFLEDTLLYDKVRDWNIYIDMLDTVLQDEISIGLDRKVVERWHNIIKSYFSNKPNERTMFEFMKNTNSPAIVAEEIKNNIEFIKNDTKITSYITDLYNNFEELLEGRYSQQRS
jgi:hypothetical protein